MKKIRLTLSLLVTSYSSKWIIDDHPDQWDISSKEVEIGLDVFKELALQTNCKEELAQLVIDYSREEELNKEYNEWVTQLVKNNTVDDGSR